MKKRQSVIEALLNKFNYYKVVMPEETEVTEAEILEMFKTYGDSVFRRFLRDMCAQDIRLYFNSSNELDRNKLRGAWERTNYFIALTNKANGGNNKRSGLQNKTRNSIS
jgi:hypothetical protein